MMEAAVARLETWSRTVFGLDQDQPGRTGMTTLALGLLGLVVLGALARSAWTRSSGASQSLDGSAGVSQQNTAKRTPIKPIAQGSVSSEVAGLVPSNEAASDFLRNVRAGAIHIVSVQSGARQLGQASVAMKALVNEPGPVSNDTAIRVAAVMQDLVLKAWQEYEPDTSSLPQTLGARVVELLTVSPTMDVLLDAHIMPPSMSQPAYTLVVARGEVRCITEGFVGSPLLGPADPNQKYTMQRLRLLSSNVLDVTSSSTSRELRLEYCIMATQAKRSTDILTGTHASLRELCGIQHAITASTWQDFLLSS
ncbi:Hypothetical Protein FCC1311_109962 [Hondaea fermentalgiana]|uniref:Uncharacterized protein n=1 Tax=Hondaea fermentalgiana TaxID=2315210 RepID=A0A2R5H2Z3_9STRA|nr:Hypothetical Protein FCC1311_109962 [Hondaea fermentalgiana]|eukprot:GBG34774.1 Hypothetical Protein FCC1311_109962 [Hondaea fermentalgiana]